MKKLFLLYFVLFLSLFLSVSLAFMLAPLGKYRVKSNKTIGFAKSTLAELADRQFSKGSNTRDIKSRGATMTAIRQRRRIKCCDISATTKIVETNPRNAPSNLRRRAAINFLPDARKSINTRGFTHAFEVEQKRALQPLPPVG